MEWLKILVGTMVFLILPGLITSYVVSDIIQIRPGFEVAISSAIYLGLIWIEVKAWNSLEGRWRFPWSWSQTEQRRKHFIGESTRFDTLEKWEQYLSVLEQSPPNLLFREEMIKEAREVIAKKRAGRNGGACSGRIG
jgi:hypothetical protein